MAFLGTSCVAQKLEGHTVCLLLPDLPLVATSVGKWDNVQEYPLCCHSPQNKLWSGSWQGSSGEGTAAKPGNLTLVPGIHWGGEENQDLSSDRGAYTHMQIRRHDKMKLKGKLQYIRQFK